MADEEEKEEKDGVIPLEVYLAVFLFFEAGSLQSRQLILRLLYNSVADIGY